MRRVGLMMAKVKKVQARTSIPAAVRMEERLIQMSLRSRPTLDHLYITVVGISMAALSPNMSLKPLKLTKMTITRGRRPLEVTGGKVPSITSENAQVTKLSRTLGIETREVFNNCTDTVVAAFVDGAELLDASACVVRSRPT